MTHTLHSSDPFREPADDFEVAERNDPVVRLLESVRIEAHRDLVPRVMARLPQASWSSRRFPLGMAAAVAAVLMALGAAFLLGGSEAGTGIAALEGLIDLVSTGLLAGGGFLAASWSGARATLGEAIRESPTTTLAVAVLLIGLSAGLIRLVGRRREARVASRDRGNR